MGSFSKSKYQVIFKDVLIYVMSLHGHTCTHAKCEQVTIETRRRYHRQFLAAPHGVRNQIGILEKLSE